MTPSPFSCAACADAVLNPRPDDEDYMDYEDDYGSGSGNPRSTGTVSMTQSESSSDSEVLNTSYRKATPLFREIEREHWEAVLRFLTTGKWTNGLLSRNNEHMKSPAADLQVKTWVTSYDYKGVPEWSQLPIHAAISYNAPLVVIQKLVAMYPKSIRCTDNEGMLPIHLAFGFGAQDGVLALLLEPFPMSINEKGLGGRFPYECCELGPNKARHAVYKIVADQVSKRIHKQVDEEWRDVCLKAMQQQQSTGDYQDDPNGAKLRAKETASLEYDIRTKSLTDFMLQLLKDRQELQELKRAVTVSASQQKSRRGKLLAGRARTGSGLNKDSDSTIDSNSIMTGSNSSVSSKLRGFLGKKKQADKVQAYTTTTSGRPPKNISAAVLKYNRMQMQQAATSKTQPSPSNASRSSSRR